MKKMNKKGFTIVELVIVIAVIAVLAAVMIPTFGGLIDKAEESNALSAAKNAHTTMIYSISDIDEFDGYIAVNKKADNTYEFYYIVEDGKLVETDGKVAAVKEAPTAATGKKYDEVLEENADISADIDVFQLVDAE